MEFCHLISLIWGIGISYVGKSMSSKKKKKKRLSRDTFPNLALFVLISVLSDWTFNHALYNILSTIGLMILVGKLIVWLR